MNPKILPGGNEFDTVPLTPPEDLEEIEKYRKELLSMPEENRKKLLKKELAKEKRELKKKAADDEAKRFFNHPSADADFEHWSKASYWTLDEAVALIHGKDPKAVTWEQIKDFSCWPLSPFIEKYKNNYDLVIRAKNFNQLKDRTPPGKFLSWAQRSGFEIPEELLSLVQEREVASPVNRHSDSELRMGLVDLNTLTNQINWEQVHKESILEQVTGDQESVLLVSRSEYWNDFVKRIIQAIDAFPDWRQAHRKIQKSSNLHEWLLSQFKFDTREVEIVKKVLSDIFDIP